MTYDVASVKAAHQLSAVVSELTGQTPKRVGGEFRFRCMFHDDTIPSFNVNDEKDGGVYLCRSCGAKGDVVAFVQQSQHLDFQGALEFLARRSGVMPIGLSSISRPVVDRTHEKRPSRVRPDEIEREHVYQSAGVVVARKILLKARDADGKKQMRWQRPNGPGRWCDGLDALDPGLFGLEEAMRHKGAGSLVCAEGEKDAAALLAIGVPAVSSPHGAGGKWLPSYTEAIGAAGFTMVYVIGDRDAAGEHYNQTVTRALHGSGLTDSRPVPWESDRPEGFDVADFLVAHPTDGKAQVITRCQQADAWVDSPPSSAAERDGDQVAELRAPSQLITAAGPAPSVAERSPVAVVEWPNPLAQSAYFGVFGEIVTALEPHTEADPAAILIQQLVMFGSVIGRTAHFRAEADIHYLNLFAVVVGTSAKGRKGVSTGRARRIYEPIDPTWSATCLKVGLSSGEGLIWAVRDAIEKQNPVKQAGRVVEYQTVVEDPGVSDKRLLVIETEFASTLRVLAREGNTLSALMRQAWDGLDLRVLTKNSPAKATGAHISVIGNITCGELRRYLDATEAANGFGNRFLWGMARRSKLLPDGGGTPDLDHLVARVRRGVQLAGEVGEMRRDADANELWHQLYPRLSAGRPGLLGAMTARAEPQVMRMACLYALSDLSPLIRRRHLEAALEVWRYCFDSASFIFGQSLGDPAADAILTALRSAGTEGLTRTQISKLFAGNRASSDIARALSVLESGGLARRGTMADTGGRPVECWYYDSVSYERNEISPPMGVQPADSSFNSFNSSLPKPIESAPSTEPVLPVVPVRQSLFESETEDGEL